MVTGNTSESDLRRKRIERLKKIIVSSFILLLVTPIILCIVLLIKVNHLEKKINQMVEIVAEYNQTEGINEETRDVISEDLTSFADTQNVEQNINENDTESLLESGNINEDSRLSDNIEKETNIDVSGNDESVNVRKVYLTFDDGPSANTAEILDVLEKYGVKATFFVVGKEDAYSCEMLKEIVAGGHTLGMHSYSHKYSEIYASKESFMQDFNKLRNFLEETIGVRSIYYRFPGGSSNTVSSIDMRELASALEGEEVVYFDWNVSSGDGVSSLLSVEELIKNSTDMLEQYSNAIILFHDSAEKETTVEALPYIIEKIQSLENTVILPITEDTVPVQHVYKMDNSVE